MRALIASPWSFRLWVALILFSQSALAGRWADALIGLVLAPGPGQGGWLRLVAQKGYHVVLFGGMGALLALRTRPPSLAGLLGWCIGFGAFAEALQVVSANRHPSPWDALLNAVAAFAAYALTARAGALDSRRGSFAPRPR